MPTFELFYLKGGIERAASFYEKFPYMSGTFR